MWSPSPLAQELHLITGPCPRLSCVVVCPVPGWFWPCLVEARPQTSAGFVWKSLGFCLTLVMVPNPALLLLCGYCHPGLAALLPLQSNFSLLQSVMLGGCQPAMEDARTGFAYRTVSVGAKKFHQQVKNTSCTWNQLPAECCHRPKPLC